MKKGLAIEITLALIATDSHVLLRGGGKLFTIPTKYLEKMGLPPYRCYSKGRLIYQPNPKEAEK